MIVIDGTKPGMHAGKRVKMDDDRATCVHFDGTDGYIITAENGQQRTRMGLTTEAARALWFALGAALDPSISNRPLTRRGARRVM